MKSFIYTSAMISGLLLATSCTESEEAGVKTLRTKSISTVASARNDAANPDTGNPDAAPDANRPTPDTRMAYDDYDEEGMFLSWQPTDAFKGFYTTPQVQEVVGPETTPAPCSRETLRRMWMKAPLATFSILLPAAPETRGRKPKPPWRDKCRTATNPPPTFPLTTTCVLPLSPG